MLDFIITALLHLSVHVTLKRLSKHDQDQESSHGNGLTHVRAEICVVAVFF